MPELTSQFDPTRLENIWETKIACLKGVFRTTCDPQLFSALPREILMTRVAFLAPMKSAAEDGLCGSSCSSFFGKAAIAAASCKTILCGDFLLLGRVSIKGMLSTTFARF
ncbi:hypothetical protein RJ639_019018 [Escallonia herrerae]|uniref:Uncharacterized protein n=1 Tax=Escallonia herrerae TaxID=1293975 RepID=A0AA88VAG0_9ASTE|nr:hypothetical protein RJ639_019018 [Escallonia herrerae]